MMMLLHTWKVFSGFPDVSSSLVVTFMSAPKSCEIRTSTRPLLATHRALALAFHERARGVGEMD